MTLVRTTDGASKWSSKYDGITYVPGFCLAASNIPCDAESTAANRKSAPLCIIVFAAALASGVGPAVDVLLHELHFRVDAARAEDEALRLSCQRRECEAVHGAELVRLRQHPGEDAGAERAVLLLDVREVEVARSGGGALPAWERERRVDPRRLRELLREDVDRVLRRERRRPASLDDEVVALRAERRSLGEELVGLHDVADDLEVDLRAKLLRRLLGAVRPGVRPRAVVLRPDDDQGDLQLLRGSRGRDGHEHPGCEAGRDDRGHDPPDVRACHLHVAPDPFSLCDDPG